MTDQDFLQNCLQRMQEARLYSSQGINDEATRILRDVLEDIARSDLSEEERENLRDRIAAHLEELEESEPQTVPDTKSDESEFQGLDPRQSYNYAKVLMDGQFWEEAIREFKKTAAAGYQVMECWERCGDCAMSLENWEDAIRYYEIVYTSPLATEEEKKRLLVKITKCSKKTLNQQGKKTTPPPSSQEPRENRSAQGYSASNFSTVSSRELQYALDRFIGQRLQSWRKSAGGHLAEQPHTYHVRNLLHVGMTSMVFELEEEKTGELMAGQTLVSPWDRCLSPEALAHWAHSQMMADCDQLVHVHDLAVTGSRLFVVREYLPHSLLSILTEQETLMPLPKAISLGHQILEAVGYLHLHLGLDNEKWRIYHLDLRPSRVLVNEDKSKARIYNGGLWWELTKACPTETHVQSLPLAVLPYRAPEQFRAYLARRRPPFFTDIYLFGVLFYEMLTGHPPCQASSFEQYEIAHCDQYPVPPKVWRPEIPEELSQVVTKCLEKDPLKRWRSATQLSLTVEKFLS
jgi:hypothetical protein